MGIPDENILCDLGHQPLSNSYLTKAQLNEPEITYPLVPRYCARCGLVQLDTFEAPANIFSDYAYLSGQSQGWTDHCRKFAQARSRWLNPGSLVIEVASNDGTLLKEFRKLGHRVLGVEPALNVALRAIDDGIITSSNFMTKKFGKKLAKDGIQADLVVANNVLAHVPDLDDFLAGIHKVMSPTGILSIEVPDLRQLMKQNAFDTIYHEHFSYFALETLADALGRRGFRLQYWESIPTHGGSLRVGATKESSITRFSPRFIDRLQNYYKHPVQLRSDFLYNLRLFRRLDPKIVIAAYGAPAKGNTFFNYCGIHADDIDFVVDSTPTKQDHFLPGSHIPILHPDAIDEFRPDLILLMPWNWEDELRRKLSYTKALWNPTIQTPRQFAQI